VQTKSGTPANGVPDLISVRIARSDLTGGSSIRANPAAVGIPEAACAIDADAATPASAAAATNDHAAAATKASATATAETTTTAETTAAAAATATAATTTTTGVSRRARCGQQQCRSADDAEAVNADQGKRCQPACKKIARGILSHLVLPVGEAVRLYGFFCLSSRQMRVSDACEIGSYRRTGRARFHREQDTVKAHVRSS
jgi:hypothetical protein